jgi:hypothetical protein
MLNEKENVLLLALKDFFKSINLYSFYDFLNNEMLRFFIFSYLGNYKLISKSAEFNGIEVNKISLFF